MESRGLPTTPKSEASPLSGGGNMAVPLVFVLVQPQETTQAFRLERLQHPSKYSFSPALSVSQTQSMSVNGREMERDGREKHVAKETGNMPER